MSTNDTNWFQKLFINECKAVQESRNAQTSIGNEVVATIENNVLVIKNK